ncbi:MULTISPECIES: MipA/OmpV family protein [unclassified Minwuia]|jgi:MipA family protein|uniref:MipA/OmpV family protein n=1 Tax=unclassified Minwuia TaxID=2618799 RepID=UPI00247B001D|nr:MULTISPECIES: MipA/OmpV family protein [unclassified Minwuia]
MTRRTTPVVLALALAVAVPQIVRAQEQGNPGEGESDWQISVGAGVITGPLYLGDDAYAASAVPNVRVTYKDLFFASLGEGVGYNLIKSGGWRVGPVAKYDFGREEDGDQPLRIAGGRTNDLVGLGDVDGTVELGGFVEYSVGNVSGKLELRQGIGGHEGLVGNLELRYSKPFRLGRSAVFVSFGPQMAFADSNYMSTYFDVNAAQSAASGLTPFDAEGGLLSYGLGGAVMYPVTRDLSVTWFAGYDRLAGDAAGSSLVQQRGSADQFAGGLFLTYTFGM